MRFLIANIFMLALIQKQSTDSSIFSIAYEDWWRQVVNSLRRAGSESPRERVHYGWREPAMFAELMGRARLAKCH